MHENIFTQNSLVERREIRDASRISQKYPGDLINRLLQSPDLRGWERLFVTIAARLELNEGVEP